MKRIILGLTLVILLMGLVGEVAATTRYLMITTATTGGTYYAMGVGMATLWTDKLKPEIIVSAQSSAGWVENVDILRKKEADLALVQGLAQVLAWEGRGMFEGKPFREMRAIARVWPNVEHFVITKDKVKAGTVEDIKGLRFCPGSMGSGTELSTRLIMEQLGMTFKDIKPEHVGYFESAGLMKDGRLDGASLVAGIPVPAVSDLFASPLKVEILEFTDEQLAKVQAKYPFWYRYIIPAKTYFGQDKPVRTIAQPNLLVVRADIEEEVVYKLTKILFENLRYIRMVHAAAKELTLEGALDGVSMALHPGAYRYYKEKGLKIPEVIVPR